MFSLLRKRLRHKPKRGASLRQSTRKNAPARSPRTPDMAMAAASAVPILYKIGEDTFYGPRQLSNTARRSGANSASRTSQRGCYVAQTKLLAQARKPPRAKKVVASSDSSDDGVSSKSEKENLHNGGYDSGFQSDDKLDYQSSSDNSEKRYNPSRNDSRSANIQSNSMAENGRKKRPQGLYDPKLITEDVTEFRDHSESDIQTRLKYEQEYKNKVTPKPVPGPRSLARRPRVEEVGGLDVHRNDTGGSSNQTRPPSISRPRRRSGDVSDGHISPSEYLWLPKGRDQSSVEKDGRWHNQKSYVHSSLPHAVSSSVAEDAVGQTVRRREKVRSHMLCSSTRDKLGLCQFILNDVIGSDHLLTSHFGTSKVTYLDYVASGRPLKCIETYIRHNVMPTYANTHTEVSFNAQQTTKFREEARAIIRESVNATDDDVVIFTGSGTTAAVNKLLFALDLNASSYPPVVFVGPYEHHSNILPWREAGATVVTIRATPNGLVDLEHLSVELQKFRTGPDQVLIGSFSAASNVTGILTDVDSIATIMHKHGGYALFDYACAAPYVDLDMNPTGKNGLAYKDAIFISPHKFIGGPQTPGVLVAKKWLFHSEVPHNVGGGTVVFVRRTAHRYLSQLEHREEGGTPAIIESVRAGLVFKLKEAFTPRFIMDREHQMLRTALDAWSEVPNLIIMGDTQVDRLPIFPMLFLNPSTGRLVHHDFIAMVLNDLFGIQVRSGCACAGPYGMELLGMTEKMAARFEKLITESKRPADHTSHRTSHPSTAPIHKPGRGVSQGYNKVPSTPFSHSAEAAPEDEVYGNVDNIIFKPGFVRLNLPFFLSENCLNFVIKAIQMTAEKGWALLPLYDFDRKTGSWWYRYWKEIPTKKSLHDVSFREACFNLSKSHPAKDPSRGSDAATSEEQDSPMSSLYSTFPGFNYDEILERAEAILNEAMKPGLFDVPDNTDQYTGETDQLRWFMLPREAANVVNNRPVRHVSPEFLPFFPTAMEKKLLANGHLSYSESRDGAVYQASGVENITLPCQSGSRNY